MRAGNPGATVQTSPLDRIQQRRAVLLSVWNGHRLPRGPRLPLRGEHVSAVTPVAFRVIDAATRPEIRA
jgi:hypothetical protein